MSFANVAPERISNPAHIPSFEQLNGFLEMSLAFGHGWAQEYQGHPERLFGLNVEQLDRLIQKFWLENTEVSVHGLYLDEANCLVEFGIFNLHFLLFFEDSRE